jgi:RNA recognition motif-containing protein
METTESCRVVPAGGVDRKQAQQVVQQVEVNFHEKVLLDKGIDTAYEKHASIVMDTNKNHSSDTPTSTPYSPTTVYLTGMPIRYCTATVIEKMMSRYGTIARCTVHTQQCNKVFAFCEFIESSSATEAIRALNGRKLGGQHLLVRPAFKESSSVPSHVASIDNSSNPKRQRQQLDSKIDAIKRKLAKKSNIKDETESTAPKRDT